MGRRILAPFDSSELGTLAPDRAFEEHHDAEVVVLHVIDPRRSTYAIEGGLTGRVQQVSERIAQRTIAEVERHARERDRTRRPTMRVTPARSSSNTRRRTRSTTSS
jgi:nucleotide-binding universal stress UspA family protein